MKQVLVRGGGVAIEEVPAPVAAARQILVRVAYSSVSVGTELASVRMSGLPRLPPRVEAAAAREARVRDCP